MNITNDNIPGKSLRHHNKTTENHRQISRDLNKAKTQVDRKIRKLNDAKSRGVTHYHPKDDGAGAMHKIARQAQANADKAKEGLNNMNPLYTRGGGRLGRAYVAASKQALADSKAFTVDKNALRSTGLGLVSPNSMLEFK